MVIDSFEAENELIDSLPFTTISISKFPVKESGEYAFIPLNNFNEFKVNPFLSEKRLSNINFGFRKSVTTSFSIDIPEGYTIEAIPNSIVLKTEDKSMAITRQIIIDDIKNISMRLSSFRMV
jgi:hypothetical protein